MTDVEELIAAVDMWGRSQQHLGYRTAQSRAHDDVDAGTASLAADASDDAVHDVVSAPLVEAVRAGWISQDDSRAVKTLINRWVLDRYLTGFSGDVAADTDGNDPDRDAWIAELRRLFGDHGETRVNPRG